MVFTAGIGRTLGLTATSVGLALALPSFAGAQTANIDSSVGTDVRNESAAVSGGNVFDFSSNGRSANAPGMGSFAGGPCVGEQRAASTSFAGIALGGGMSTIDQSCSRRNWVQTLIGASQHLSDADAAVLRRLAFEVLRDDPLLQPALERLGLAVNTAEVPSGAAVVPAAAGATQPSRPTNVAVESSRVASMRPQRPARIAEGCNVVVGSGAPAPFLQMLNNNGCEVNTR
jgi:hypothetical protein